MSNVNTSNEISLVNANNFTSTICTVIEEDGKSW